MYRSPRSQMKALDLESSLEENLAAAYSAGHTWLPVVRGSLARVEGLQPDGDYRVIPATQPTPGDSA
jgi:Mg2+/Co2+ transporter CorC